MEFRLNPLSPVEPFVAEKVRRGYERTLLPWRERGKPPQHVCDPVVNAAPREAENQVPPDDRLR